MHSLCQLILNKKQYIKLNKKEVFYIPKNSKEISVDDLKKCLENSALIFTEIYGEDHPFIVDYVLKT